MTLLGLHVVVFVFFSVGREPIGSSGSDAVVAEDTRTATQELIKKYRRYFHNRKPIFVEDVNGAYCFHSRHGYMECDEYFALMNIDQNENLNRDQLEDQSRDGTLVPSIDPNLKCAPSKPLSWPILSELTSPFGMRKHPKTGRRKMHTGCDFDAKHGDPIKAAASGKMECDFGKYSCRKKRSKKICSYSGYGIQVNIFHENGLSTKYGHLKSIETSLCGQDVRAGMIIGYANNTGVSTGDHLHFEVRCNDEPMDPMKYLGNKEDTVPTPTEPTSNAQ
jgi:hypothetical protein